MKKSAFSLILTLLCITLTVLVALYGVTALNIGGILEEDTISLGLDLVGGSSVTFKAIPENDSDTLDPQELDNAIDIIRRRLDDNNLNEATIAKVGTDKVRVEIPGIKNPEEAVTLLGATAKLTFEDYAGNVIIEGKNITTAEASYGIIDESKGYEWYVRLVLDETAQKAFAEATARIKDYADGNNYISIILDEDVKSSPRVETVINQSECVINGDFNEESARQLASLIKSGQLPVSFEESELRSVNATLGSSALSKSIVAGIIGISLVMIFMILVYRLPGFISCISLIAYISIFAIVLSISKITLSLPGIAGII